MLEEEDEAQTDDARRARSDDDDVNGVNVDNVLEFVHITHSSSSSSFHLAMMSVITPGRWNISLFYLRYHLLVLLFLEA